MTTGEIYQTTARVIAGASTEVLMALARERAPDPAVFTDRAAFFWLSEISNDRMDAYYGYMDAATTLPNFAADAAAGRAILAGHNSRVLPFGYSLTGSLERAEDRTRVLSDAYTLRGLDLGGVSTDSFVDGVRAGVLRDVSVGFSLGDRGWYRCNICGNDLMDYERCRHWPGMTYEVVGEDRVTRQVLATFTVIDGRLSEYSVVYDGATPSAGILKIQEAARAGLVDARARALLEQRYRIRLPERRVVVPGATLEATMPPEPEMPADETRATEEMSAAITLGEAERRDAILDEAERLVGVQGTEQVLPALRALADELPALRALADEGRRARADLIAAALREAVRAHGAEAEDRYRPVLEPLPADSIRVFLDDWATIARQRLPAGRVTVDRADPAPPARPARPDDRTYRA